jgi:TPR repeat protein
MLWLACGSPCSGIECLDRAHAMPEGPEAMALVDEGCRQGDVLACGEQGRRLEFGIGLPAEPEAAFQIYQALCGRGVPRGCVAAGNMHLKGTAPGDDPDAAWPLFERGCAAPDADACGALAELALRLGRMEDAAATAQQACELGASASCALASELASLPPRPPDDACTSATEACLASVGWRVMNGRPDERLAARAMLQGLCDGGSTAACLDWGTALSLGFGEPEDPAGAAAIYERVCPSDPRGCHNLGVLARDGRGQPKDLTKAQGLFRGACERGVGDACVERGNLAAASSDFSEAKEAYAAACAGDAWLGCSNLAGLLLDPPPGADADPQRGLDLARQACEQGEPYGCAALGRELLMGRFTPADPDQGGPLLQFACERGVDGACGVKP